MEAHLITPASNGHKSHTANNSAPRISNSTAPSNTKKRKKTISDNTSSNSYSGFVSPNYSSSSTLPIKQDHHQQSDSPVKRKRGRPPKSILKQPLQHHSESDSVEEVENFGQSKPKRKNLQSKMTRGDLRADDSAPSSIARRLSSSPSVSSSSLSQLISRFQLQYEEMGRRYAEMGSLLAEMKNTIEESRTPSEQEIRRELLDEIQRSIFDRMPKRWSGREIGVSSYWSYHVTACGRDEDFVPEMYERDSCCVSLSKIGAARRKIPSARANVSSSWQKLVQF